MRRRRRDQLDVHALGVHVRQPAVQVRQLRPALLDHPARDGHGLGSVAPDLQGLLGAEPLGIGLGHELLQGRKQDVGVDVHGGGFLAVGAHAGSFSMVDSECIRPGTSASRTPSSIHWPSWTEALTTAFARSSRRSVNSFQRSR